MSAPFCKTRKTARFSGAVRSGAIERYKTFTSYEKNNQIDTSFGMGDSRAVCGSGTFSQERKTKRDAACPHGFGVQVFTRKNSCQFEYFSNLKPAPLYSRAQTRVNLHYFQIQEKVRDKVHHKVHSRAHAPVPQSVSIMHAAAFLPLLFSEIW